MPDCDPHSTVLLDVNLPSGSSLCFVETVLLPVNFNQVFITVFIEFLISSKAHAPLHVTALYCSQANWMSFLVISDVSLEDIFIVAAFTAAEVY